MHILLFTEQWVNGGVASFLMNLIHHFDYRNNFRVSLCVVENMTDFYDQDLLKYGVQKFVLVGNKRINPFIRTIIGTNKFKCLLQQESKEFDIVHFNICNAVSLKYAKIAKKYDHIKNIVHSHNSSVNSIVKYVANAFYKVTYSKYIDNRYACSDYAASFLFTKKAIKNRKVKYINNGIMLDKFHYNEFLRDEYRQRLGVTNQILICHIGRFIRQKNHKFLMDVFHKLNSEHPNKYKLLLIGEGALENKINAIIKKNADDKSIIRVSNTNNVPEYLFASDMFLLPSLFEGLPVVGVEAQASGLPCIFSDTITSEIKITNNILFLPIKNPLMWVEKIVNLIPNTSRATVYEYLKKANYDINDVAAIVQNEYICL